MDGDGKKPLKTAITEFYKLNSKKGKEYTVKHFKKSVHRATIYRWIKKFEATGNCDQKNMDPEPFERTSSCCKSKWTTKPFEVLK